MLILGFVSRYFQDNYLGFVTVFLTLGYLLHAESAAKSHLQQTGALPPA